MTRNVEQQIVFAIAPDQNGGPPTVILGVPRDAWIYMRDGKTHTFDLTKATPHAIPVKLVLFGGRNHDEIMRTLDAAAKSAGAAYIDARNRNFKIDEKP